MRRALILATFLSLPSLLSGCLKEHFKDGAYCSKDATCPPGQRCSADGFCLYPCPVPDCVGSDCGCEPRLAWDDVIGFEYANERLCWADGLCHAMCDHPVANVSRCNAVFTCDPGTDECVQTCVTSEDCTNGAVCTPSGGIHTCRAP